MYGPGPAPFLPPDAQQAIVLRVERDGNVLSPADFETHCEQVAKHLGRRAIQATTAYLCGESTLRRPLAGIEANLDAITARFPFRDTSRPTQPRDLSPDQPSLSGVDVMFDYWGEGDSLPDHAGWGELAKRRVRRVTALLGGGRGEGGSACIKAAKAAGVAVSIVLPIAEGKFNESSRAVSEVNTLPLSRGDIVHQVLVGIPTDATDHQAELAPTRARGVKITRYDPAKQWM